MKVKVVVEIDIDETDYVTLHETEIKQIIKGIKFDMEKEEYLSELKDKVMNEISKVNQKGYEFLVITDEIEVTHCHRSEYWNLDFYFNYKEKEYRAVFDRTDNKIEMEHLDTTEKGYRTNEKGKLILKEKIMKSTIFKHWLNFNVSELNGYYL